MKEFYFMAYPKMRIIYAENPEEALDKYKAKFTEDKREYFYTGNAYNKFVIINKNTSV